MSDESKTTQLTPEQPTAQDKFLYVTTESFFLGNEGKLVTGILSFTSNNYPPTTEEVKSCVDNPYKPQPFTMWLAENRLTRRWKSVEIYLHGWEVFENPKELTDIPSILASFEALPG